MNEMEPEFGQGGAAMRKLSLSQDINLELLNVRETCKKKKKKENKFHRAKLFSSQPKG